jgi:hypothetical protein
MAQSFTMTGVVNYEMGFEIRQGKVVRLQCWCAAMREMLSNVSYKTSQPVEEPLPRQK